MTVTVTSALAGPATARYSNVYGALVDLGVLSGLGAQDVTGSGDPVAPILNASEFYAPLTSSLILTRGTGNPTYTRATNAWEFDNEGKLILVPSGAARFGGARMVRNLLAATSTLSTQNVTTVATSYTLSFYGTGSVTLSGTATGTLNGTGASNRVQTTVTATAGTLTLTVSGSVTDAQLENVTGQDDQTASEYVSVGVLSAPYHGAGVDGVKYFPTNKDGSAISASSLLGYHAEGARTNSLLYSRNLDGKYGVYYPSKTGSALVSLDFSVSTGWTLDDGWTISGGKLNYAAGTGRNATYNITGLTVGKSYLVEVDVEAISGVSVGIYAPGIDTLAIYSRTTAGKLFYHYTTTATSTQFLIRTSSAAGSITIDNFTVTESAISVTTCTGIDNAANSASTLTAGAADATILQTLTLAAAARSFSAYVKRRTGSGSVYITRDGGTNWTDITSSLGASWTRVKIENTSVLNPSVGFKIATSGDEIDVDVCQDEAGAFISSPIITTTAAVTRNSESLYYSNANILTAAGAACLDYTNGVWGNDNTDHYLLDAQTSGHMLGRFSGGSIQWQDSTTTYIAFSPSVSWTDKSNRKIGVSWSGTSVKKSENGNSVSSLTANFTMDANVYISSNSLGWGASYTYVKNAYIWQSALTDAQLQQVTA